MSKLRYKVTLQFDAPADDPSIAADTIERLKEHGTVLKINAVKARD